MPSLSEELWKRSWEMMSKATQILLCELLDEVPVVSISLVCQEDKPRKSSVVLAAMGDYYVGGTD